MTTNDLFNEIIAITQRNVNLLHSRIQPLSDFQKNWKKDNDSWSINEIIAHLNQYANYYHRVFGRKIARTRFRTPRETFISSPLGRSAWRSMKLGNARNIKRKMKSPRAYNPSLHPEMVKSNTIEIFEKSQQELLSIFELARSVNIRKAKIPISISKIIRFRLGDAFLYVVYHNERHLQQAINILDHPRFPKAEG
jgi:hypothetical protein